MARKIKRHLLRTFGFAVMLLMIISSVVPGMISRIPLAKALPGALTSTNVQPASLVAGANGNVNVTFTTTSGVPNDGKILIWFPSTFTLDSMGAGTTTATARNIYGGTTYQGTVSGQTVTLIGDGIGTGIGAAETVTNLTLSNILNQQWTGTTGAYSITTTTNGFPGPDVPIDGDTGVTADTFTAGVLVPSDVTPETLVAGAIGAATVTFRNANPIPSDGAVRVTFPTNYALSSGGTSVMTCSFASGAGDTGTSIIGPGNIATFVRTGLVSAVAAGGTQTCSVTLVRNQFSGATSAYTIATFLTGVSTGIDSATATGSHIITAAAAGATVTLGTNSVVGTAGNTTLNLTLPEALASSDTVVFTLPNNLVVPATPVGTLTAGGGTITCSGSGQIITCTVDLGPGGTAGSNAIVLTNITSRYAASGQNVTSVSVNYQGNSLQVEASTASGSVATATTATDASATVTLLTPTVGATQSTQINFSLPIALKSGDTVEFTLPSDIYVAGLDTTAAAQNFGGAGTFDCTATQLMVCTANGTVNSGAATMTLTGVTGRYVLSTQILTDFKVKYQAGATDYIAVDTSVAVDSVTTPQASGTTNATVTLGANSVVGTAGDTSINFTLPVPLISGDTVEFTLPANLDITGLTTTGALQSFGGAGTFACTVTTPIICTTNEAVSAGGGTITLLGIKSKYAASGQILTDFQVKYQAGATAVIAVDTSVALVTATTPGALSSATVTPGSLVAGATPTDTIAFTAANPIPNLGKIVVTYPSGFAPAGANALTAGTLVGLDGTWTAGVSGQVVTFTQTGGAGGGNTAGAKSFTIAGVRNPQVSGDTGTFTITTETSSGAAIDTLTTVPLVTITAGALTSATVVPASLVAGTDGNVVISFTTANPIANDGQIVIDFPSTFDGTGSNAISSLTGIDGTASVAVGNGDGTNDIVTVTRLTGSTIGSGVAVQFTINSIRNPQVTGATGAYKLYTKTAAAVPIDQLLTVAQSTIAVGALTGTNVEPDSLSIGHLSANTITFTTANPIPNTGKIVVTYPSGFDVSGANTLVASDLSGLDGVWTATTSGQVVTFTQTTGGISAAGAKRLRIANIVNPGGTGSTGTYTITTTTAGDVNIETDAAVTADTIVVNQNNGSGGSGGSGGGGSADTTPPTNTSVAIVGAPKVPTANVQLTLAATGATEMMISNTADFTGATWETYKTLKDWTLNK